MHMPSPNTVAPAQGLYQPDEFKDNCGFGLIAHMQGEASHHLVETAIHSLSCMTHRGGIAADGKTGDGCGLLLAMPCLKIIQLIVIFTPSLIKFSMGLGVHSLLSNKSSNLCL